MTSQRVSVGRVTADGIDTDPRKTNAHVIVNDTILTIQFRLWAPSFLRDNVRRMRFSSATNITLALVLAATACGPSSSSPGDNGGTSGGGSTSSTQSAPTGACAWMAEVVDAPVTSIQMGAPAKGDVDVFAQNKALGRGINLGNALDAPQEGGWGPKLAAWMFEAVKREGFDSIRLPVKWSGHALDNEPYTIEKKFFERVDWAVAQALSRGLKIVIDMHHYGNTDEDGMFNLPEENHLRFIGLWKQIAEHYKDYPKEVYFELLNEPRDKLVISLWNQYIAEAVDVIRQTNPGRTIIVGGLDYNKYHRLKEVKFPDENIIATFHYYNPYCFTHDKGQLWEAICKPNVDKSAKIGSWPVIWPATDPTPKETEILARDTVTKNIQEAVAWSKAEKRPLYMGEFGATDLANITARTAYTTALVKLAVQNDISFAYWQFTSSFGMWEAKKCAFQPDLLAALKATPDETTGVLMGSYGGSTGAGGATGAGGTTGGGGATSTGTTAGGATAATGGATTQATTGTSANGGTGGTGSTT